jgi:hypothetical protein
MQVDREIGQIDHKKQQETHQFLGQRIPECSLYPIVCLRKWPHCFTQNLSNIVNSIAVSPDRQVANSSPRPDLPPNPHAAECCIAFHPSKHHFTSWNIEAK